MQLFSTAFTFTRFLHIFTVLPEYRLAFLKLPNLEIDFSFLIFGFTRNAYSFNAVSILNLKSCLFNDRDLTIGKT